MNTSELIKKLQLIDPEGNKEVFYGNNPICEVIELPAWYDGNSYEAIYKHEDRRFEDAGDIIGFKPRSTGTKVEICVYDMFTLTEVHGENAKLDLSDVSPSKAKSIQEYMDSKLVQHKQIEEEFAKFRRNTDEVDG